MANSFFGLNIGTTGLYAANANLTVAANNIANEATEGYSRQKATQVATTPLRIHQRFGSVGTGVEVTEIVRSRDEYYDFKYWDNQSKYGEFVAKNYYMMELEDRFNDTEDSGFSIEYNNIFKALETIQKEADGNTARAMFINYADSFVRYMEEIKTNLILQQEDINAEVNDTVDNINAIAQEIATINKQINVVELKGSHANELRDRRALLLDELSTLVEIETKEVLYENGKSDFYVTISGKSLVNNYDFFSLMVETREEKCDTDDAVGLYDVKWSYGDELDVIGENLNGSLYALLQIRDGNNGVPEAGNPNSITIDYKGIPYYMEEINQFLTSFTDEFNAIQAKGMDLNGGSGADNPIFMRSPNGVFSVNQALMDDPTLLCTTVDIHQGSASYDLIEEMIATKEARYFEGGTAIEYLNALVTEVAIDTKRASTQEKNYTNLQKTIQNQRLSVMGVDPDEESMNLVKYKEAYDLSSKIISIMNEIYQRLINDTGV